MRYFLGRVLQGKNLGGGIRERAVVQEKHAEEAAMWKTNDSANGGTWRE
jgi:hypothetical protein